MWLTRVSIQNPHFTAALMVALFVSGLLALKRLPVEEFPDVRFPIAVVTTVYPGASPEVVEAEVTRPIEEVANTVAGVRHIRSVSLENVATVIVEFSLGADPSGSVQDLRERIAAIQGSFRREIRTPAVGRVNPVDQPLVSLAVIGADRSPRELTAWVERTLRPRLQTALGVGEVKLVGAAKSEVRIDVDPRRLRELGLDVAEVADAIGNANLDFPAGKVARGPAEQVAVRLAGRLRTLGDFGELIVGFAKSQPIRLGDFATVREGEAAATSLALLDGKRAVALDVRAARGANVVETAANVRRVVAEVARDAPPGVELHVTYDKSVEVKDSLRDVAKTLVEGAALTIAIVLVFLGSWRSTIITGLALPLALLGTFCAMLVMGFTLNLMTLTALSLAIGFLIDDAIVVRENIVRHLALGKTPDAAALDGTREIGLAVLATTLTIVAVFLPLAFMGGMIGRFFAQFGWTVTVAVLVSMLVSFTLDPMLSSVWRDPDHARDGRRSWIARSLAPVERALDRLAEGYARTIRWVLAHRLAVLGAAAALFAASLALVPLVGSEFVPKGDYGSFSVKVRTPVGTPLATSEDRVRAASRALASLPEVRSIAASIGDELGAGASVATLVIDAGPAAGRDRGIAALMEAARGRLAGVEGIRVEALNALGGPGLERKPVEVGIRGPDLATLERLAEDLKRRLAAIPGVVDLESGAGERERALAVEVERDAAARRGVDVARVGMTLSTLLAGATVTTWQAPDGATYDVRLQVPEAQRVPEIYGVMAVGSVRRGPDGAPVLVPLAEVTRVTETAAPARIDRADLHREVTITGNVSGTTSGIVFDAIDRLAADYRLPAGYAFAQSGESEDMRESFGYALEALALGVILIYLVLVAQFRSFLQPVTIMTALPLAIIGALAGLLVAGSTLNAFSVIGIVVLMGLAAKNGILLVDFVNQARRAGLARDDAIAEAGRVRLRPILMTSVAMICGMLPLALASGPAASTRASLAHAVIGGMLSSTALTLFVVPVVYTYLDGLAARAAARFR